MKNGYVILILCLLFFSGSYAQNSQKIQKKLQKTLFKGKFEKLEKKAKKLSTKYPTLDEPNYYLSLVELNRFKAIENTPKKKQWNHLRKASTYAKKLPDNYLFLHDTIKVYYQKYIDSWNDKHFESAHLKKVVKSYSTFSKDTLQVYHSYFIEKPREKITGLNEIPLTDSLRMAMLEFATALVGIPYKYAGEKPEIGFDCSGFVKYVYKSIGIELPHNAHLQSKLEGENIALEDAKPGDLIFFGSQNGETWNTQHAGIIFEFTTSEPKVIHCVSRGVSIDGNNSSWDHYWKERILFIKRLPQLD